MTEGRTCKNCGCDPFPALGHRGPKQCVEALKNILAATRDIKEGWRERAEKAEAALKKGGRK